MPGIKEICALFAAAGLGAGGTVGVQYATPAVRKAVQRPAPARRAPLRPAVQRALPAQPRIAAAPPPIACIPTLGGAPGDIASLSDLPGATLPGAPAIPGSILPMGGPFVPGTDYAGGDPWDGGFLRTPPGPDAPGPNPGPNTPGGPDGPNPGGTPGVPEPAAWAMLVGGFGLLGLAMRRRKGADVHIRQDIS